MTFTCSSCGEEMDGKRAMGHEIGGCPKEIADREAKVAACTHPEDERFIDKDNGQVGCTACDSWLPKEGEEK
jgi:hypothetical protein